MRRIQQVLVLTLLAYFSFVGIALAAEADKPLTNAEVLVLVRGGVDADLIVSKIEQAPLASFDVSTDALIELSKQSVPKNVIDAMIRRMKWSAPGGKARPEASSGIARVVRVELVSGDQKWDLEAKQATFSATMIPFGSLNWLNIPEAHASVRVANSTPTIRAFCEGTSNAIGIVRLESNRSDRSLKLSSSKMYSMNSVMNVRVDRDWFVTEKWRETSPGVWDAVLSQPLKKGEYGLVDVKASTIYGFGID
jgi:hypothetical protein